MDRKLISLDKHRKRKKVSKQAGIAAEMVFYITIILVIGVLSVFIFRQ